MSPPRVQGELHHFLLLSADEQADAIRRLAVSGMSVSTIATATRLSIEQVRCVLANDDAPAVQNARLGAIDGDAH